MADKTVELQAEAAVLRAELDRLRKTPTVAPGQPQKVSGRFISTRPFYRLGHLYAPGTVFTATNEYPGRTWKRVEAQPVTADVVVDSRPDARTGRPSDKPAT